MHRGNFICLPAGILMVMAVLLPVATAQYETDFQNSNRLDLKDSKTRKNPGIFHMPAKDTPAGQLEFAEKLLADGKQKAAKKQFSALVHKWHTSPEAPLAQLAYARILYDRNDYDGAFDEFQYLVDNFAGQFPYEEVIDKQFRIANFLMTAKRMKFLFMPGFSVHERALPLFEKIVKNAPNWKNSVEAQYNIGFINEQIGNYTEAINAYEICRYRYPDSVRAGDADFRRAYCLYLTANENIRDETMCRQALSAMAGFVADNPKHGSIDLAMKCRDKLDERLTGMYYEKAAFYDKAGKRKAAIIAYEDFIRKFPSSRLAGDVSARIETLKMGLENKK